MNKKPTYNTDELIDVIPLLDTIREIQIAAELIGEERKRYTLVDFRMLMYMLQQRVKTIALKGGYLF